MPSISPEYWNLLPTVPEFGSLMDVFGGKSVPPVETTCEDVSYSELTSNGLVTICKLEKDIRVTAEDVGIGFLYSREGKLKNVVVDLLQYFSNIDDKIIELMGNEKLVEMLEEMIDDEKNYNITLNLEERFVLMTNTDGESFQKEFLAEDLNFAKGVDFFVNYGRHVMHWIADELDGELRFGFKVFDKGDTVGVGDQILVIKVCSDCNVMTYLDSRSEDRFERLSRRIFMDD